MEPFESYAKRIIDALPPADPITEESEIPRQLPGLSELTGQLIEISPPHTYKDFANPEQQPIIAVEDLLDPSLTRKLTDDMKKVCEEAILATGLEALAFYKSIHFDKSPPFPNSWGIFIFDYAISYLIDEIEEYYPKIFSQSEKLMKAYKLLYYHERFHFRFDHWVISHESSMNSPLYENYRNKVYIPNHPHKLVVEETLANKHTLYSLRGEEISKYVKEFMLSQPGAYSNIIGIDDIEYKSKLAAQLFYGSGAFTGVSRTNLPEHSSYLAMTNNAKKTDASCPVYIVKGVSPSRFIVPKIFLPTLNEIKNGFIKKYLRGKEVSRTDHAMYKIDNGAKIKMPNPHAKQLKLREFSNIIMKAGLQQKEFYEERERTKIWKRYIPRDEIKPCLV